MKLFGHGYTLVTLFSKDGITSICQLYNAMLNPPESFGQEQISSFDSFLLEWQRGMNLQIIVKIINVLIEMPYLRDNPSSKASFETLDIEKVTEPYSFTSLQHFFANYYNHFMEILAGW